MADSPSALADRFSRHGAMLRVHALRLTRNEAEADDLVQESFARALARLDSLPDHGNLASWLAMILHDVFMDACRRRKTRQRARNRHRHQAGIHASDAVEPPAWATASRDEVTAIIAELPPTLRDCYLRKVEGQSYRQIARELGIPWSTVSTRIQRARETLRAKLSRQVAG